MKKKEIKKLFKHIWIDHLIMKYKYVECENEYREYKKFRIWFVIFGWLLLIATSPIWILILLWKEKDEWIFYPDGRFGREEYVLIRKDNL